MEKRKFKGVWLSKPLSDRRVRKACRWTGRGLHGMFDGIVRPFRRRLRFKRTLSTFVRCNGREKKLRGRLIYKRVRKPFGDARLACELLRLRLSAFSPGPGHDAQAGAQAHQARAAAQGIQPAARAAG